MEALYLKSQGLTPEDLGRLCAISPTTFYRYLHEYRTGGIEKLTEVPFHRRQSPLAAYRTSIEADLRQRPPARVAEAAARIADLTGLQRGPTQVRQF
jgi:transposase